MGYDKRLALIEKMHEHTQNGRVDWEETVNNNEFIVSKSNLSVVVNKGQNQNNGTLYTFSIMDEEGDTIDEFNDESWGEDDHIFGMCRDLYNMARGYAKGTEQALDKLLTSFGDVPF